MQADFHYCCVKVLAAKAGFDETESELLAYASQYVDNATAHKPIRIAGVPAEASRLAQDGAFEPVCTAHSGIQYLSAMNRDVQRKVYIPFHFVPGDAYSGTGAYDYRVRSSGAIVRELVLDGLGAVRDAASAEARSRALIKTGVAIHSFADSWSHQRFSGRHSAGDNDIERIRLRIDGGWQGLGFLRQVGANILPDIGHAEALEFPDYSHLTWAYEHDASGLEVARNNAMIFLEAAEAIHSLLSTAGPGARSSWKSVIGRIQSCLGLETDSVKNKFCEWARLFPEVAFTYDPRRWRAEALTGGPLDWEHYQTAADFDTLSLTATGDLKWFYFHLAARDQREKVNSKVRADLL